MLALVFPYFAMASSWRTTVRHVVDKLRYGPRRVSYSNLSQERWGLDFIACEVGDPLLQFHIDPKLHNMLAHPVGSCIMPLS